MTQIGASVPTPPALSASASDDRLSNSQLHALFDVLTHYETYYEAQSFKFPDIISRYGYPFALQSSEGEDEPSYASESSAPLLATLFRSIILPLPPVQDVPSEFWSVRFQGIMSRLGEAELSESYDKGALGTRKTLATAASAIHEAVTRGYLGGIAKGERRDLGGEYRKSSANDLVRAWHDVVHELVYGTLVDELFDCARGARSIEEHSPAVERAVDYVIVHLATFIHHIFVISADGPYLLKLIENAHKLVPYSIIKQTLRIGNAATMINGMMKLLLAKVSLGALSNWVGLTQNAEDGMNLLQRIISLVLTWDAAEFRKSTEKIEKARQGPSKEQLAAIKQFISKPRDVHDKAREASVRNCTSIIVEIFSDADPELLESLTAIQHAQCLEYYSALLSVRDRDEIIRVLCRQTPDLFTQAVREAAVAMESRLRMLHERVDLREHLSAFEAFLNDFISTSKSKDRAKEANGIANGIMDGIKGAAKKNSNNRTRAPSVEDYANLLRRNRHLLYNYLHQVACECPEIESEFRTWSRDTVKIFQQHNRRTESGPDPVTKSTLPQEIVETTTIDDQRAGAAGAMSSDLQALFAALPTQTRGTVRDALDAHASYLSQLESLSSERLQQVLSKITGGPGATADASISGPGMFLSRWQSFLDETPITPATPRGAVRLGKDVKMLTVHGKTGTSLQNGDVQALARQARRKAPDPPNVDAVVSALGPAFRDLLVDIAKSTNPSL